MYKIAAFIKFNKKIQNKVLDFKKKVKQEFGNQIYLNHPVHLTLFTLNIKKLSELKKIYNKLKLNKKEKSIKIKFSKTAVFYNDPLTDGHTIFFKANKNRLLSEIQIKNLKYINKKINVLKKTKINFKNKILIDNYKKFGFPFSGNIWVPHITISSIKNISQNHKFLKNFLRKKIQLSDDIKYIEFYKIKKDKHFFLFKTVI